MLCLLLCVGKFCFVFDFPPCAVMTAGRRLPRPRCRSWHAAQESVRQMSQAGMALLALRCSFCNLSCSCISKYCNALLPCSLIWGIWSCILIEVLERDGVWPWKFSKMMSAAELGWNPGLHPKEPTSCMGMESSCPEQLCYVVLLCKNTWIAFETTWSEKRLTQAEWMTLHSWVSSAKKH